MTKAELMALLAEKKDDEDVGVLKTDESNPLPTPQPNTVPTKPKTDPVSPTPQPQPKPNEIKADTVVTGTAAELIQLFAPLFEKEKPKEEKLQSAEVYI